MIDLKTIAAGAAIAGTLGLAALGLGAGVANAAPPDDLSGSGFAQDWSHGNGGGPGWNGGGHGGDWNRGGWNGGGRGWGPPPPPNYGYGGYGSYDNYGGPGGCVTGPLGLLHFCN